jgi:hypothetical protein
MQQRDLECTGDTEEGCSAAGHCVRLVSCGAGRSDQRDCGRRDPRSLAATCEPDPSRREARGGRYGWAGAQSHPRSIANEDDLASQVAGRSAQAMVLASRGRFDAAEEAGREAVEMYADAECPNAKGDAWMDLAQVLRMAGKDTEAANAARKARVLFERKGNQPSSEATRAVIAELVPDIQRMPPGNEEERSSVGARGFEPLTSSVSGKRSPPELSARAGTVSSDPEASRGGDRNRTGVRGFAGPCLTTRPPRRNT